MSKKFKSAGGTSRHITLETKEAIRKLAVNGKPTPAIAKRYNLSEEFVKKIIAGTE